MARTFGHPPFAYLWSSGDTTQTISGDYDAEYCVTVTDALGCTSEDCALFPSDRFCKTEIQINPNSIAAQAGLRLVARTKGHGPFKYLWSTQDTSKSIPIVSSVTNYCVTVTDITGCVSNTCIDLEDLMDRCKVSIVRRSPNQIMAVPQGIPPFKYLWNNGSKANHIKIDSAGSYCVEMEDALGCISSACIEIKENDLPSLCNVRIKAIRIGNGEIKLIVQTPGNTDYKIEWDNGANTSSIVINNPGTYCVTVSNAFCKAETCITLDPNQNINEGIGKVIGRDQITTQKAYINLGPNPFRDELFLRLEAGSPGNVLLKIYGLDGRSVRKERIEVVPGINEQYLDMHHLQGGIYIVQVIGDTWQNSFRVIKQP
jgi:hypothetical protein